MQDESSPALDLQVRTPTDGTHSEADDASSSGDPLVRIRAAYTRASAPVRGRRLPLQAAYVLDPWRHSGRVDEDRG